MVRLTRPAPTLERNLREVDHRSPVEVFQGSLEGRVLEDVRDEPHFDALLADRAEDPHHLLVRFQGQGDVDLVDPLLGNHRLEIFQGSQHRHVREGATGLAGVIVEESHHVEPQLAVGHELPRDLLAKGPGSQDENTLKLCPLRRMRRRTERMMLRPVRVKARFRTANRARKPRL